MPEVVHVDKLKKFSGEAPTGWAVQYRDRKQTETDKDADKEIEEPETEDQPLFIEAAEDLLIPDPILTARDFDDWNFEQDVTMDIEERTDQTRPEDAPTGTSQPEERPQEDDTPEETGTRPKRISKTPVKFRDYVAAYLESKPDFNEEEGKESDPVFDVFNIFDDVCLERLFDYAENCFKNVHESEELVSVAVDLVNRH
jgi:hypothetical protein